MPIMDCQINGRPGLKWGEGGHCYPYTPGNKASRQAALRKVKAQELAARTAGYRGK